MNPLQHAAERRRTINGHNTPPAKSQMIKSLVADYIYKIYGEVPSDKLWDKLWADVNRGGISSEELDRLRKSLKEEV